MLRTQICIHIFHLRCIFSFLYPALGRITLIIHVLFSFCMCNCAPQLFGVSDRSTLQIYYMSIIGIFCSIFMLLVRCRNVESKMSRMKMSIVKCRQERCRQKQMSTVKDVECEMSTRRSSTNINVNFVFLITA